jgi:hypothetical protein
MSFRTLIVSVLLIATAVNVGLDMYENYEENKAFLNSLHERVHDYTRISDPFLRTYSQYTPEYYQKIQEEERRPHYGIELKMLSY